MTPRESINVAAVVLLFTATTFAGRPATAAFADSIAAVVRDAERAVAWDSTRVVVAVGGDTAIVDSALFAGRHFTARAGRNTPERVMQVARFRVTEDRGAAIPRAQQVRLNLEFVFADSTGFETRVSRVVDAPCPRKVWEVYEYLRTENEGEIENKTEIETKAESESEGERADSRGSSPETP